jgi:hypothetical protein
MNLNFSRGADRLAKVFPQLMLCLMRGQGNRAAYLGHVQRAAKEFELPELLQKAAQLTPEQWQDLANPREPGFLAEVQRAAVAAGTSTDTTWASPLVAAQTSLTGYLPSLRFDSMGDDLLQDAQLWEPGQRIAVSSATATGASAAEATWKLLSKADWEISTVGPRKAHALVVVSNDLLFRSDGLAENAITSELRRAVSVAADSVLIGILTAGLSPIACSGDARNDLDAALGAIALSANSKLHCYMPSKTLKQLCLRGAGLDGPATFPDLTFSGGSINGMSVMPVDSLSNTASFGDAIVIVDAAQLLGTPGILIPDSANSGSLWFDDTGGGTAAKSVVSLFQTSSTALRIERWFSCERPRAASVAVISHAHYSAGSP